jgi:hypothetical protein
MAGTVEGVKEIASAALPKTGEAKTAEKAVESTAGQVTETIEIEETGAVESLEPKTEEIAGAVFKAEAQPVKKKRAASKKPSPAKPPRKKGKGELSV